MLNFGRKKIYCLTAIDESNVVNVITEAIATHIINRQDITTLWQYYKGDQPILQRVKEIRPEINNKIVENHANEIVAFFAGYLLGEPCTYVSKTEDEETTEKISKINDYMFELDKAALDQSLATWLYVCGLGYRLCLPDPEGYAPFRIETLDPRNTFVIRSCEIGEPVICGVTMTCPDDMGTVLCNVYTRDRFYLLTGSQLGGELTLVSYSANPIGVPIFEYEANAARMGAFEPVISMLDAINETVSDQANGVAQFVQSLMVIYNADISEDAAKTIKQWGLVKLKSTGDQKADLKIISEELNQQGTQTLVNSMVNTVKTIVGMPNNGNGLNGGTSGNVGSVIAWQGWDLCEPRVHETELLFKKAEKQFLRLALRLVKLYRDIDLSRTAIDIKFSRRNIENLLVKTQALLNLLNAGVKPEIALATIGLWNDPLNIASQSKEYLEKWAVPQTEGEGTQDGNAIRTGSNQND